jgi:hypothetical protein
MEHFVILFLVLVCGSVTFCLFRQCMLEPTGQANCAGPQAHVAVTLGAGVRGPAFQPCDFPCVPFS